MAKIEVFGFARAKYKLLAQNVATEVVRLMKQPNQIEVATEYVSKSKIKKLNREIRGVDRVTDVLSFPATELKVGEILNLEDVEVQFLMVDGFVHFGDMAICLSQCKKQAKEFGVSIESEIKKLVIHSMLHLMGYDHIKDEDYVIMNEKEKELDKKIKI